MASVPFAPKSNGQPLHFRREALYSRILNLTVVHAAFAPEANVFPIFPSQTTM